MGKSQITYAIGGGGGGGFGTFELESISFGGAGGIGAVGCVGVTGAIDCFRLGLEISLRQCEQVNFCTLGVRNKRVESSRFSSSVARCTSVSAQSHIISLIASFGSIRSKCCNMLKNGISCGVSATWAFNRKRSNEMIMKMKMSSLSKAVWQKMSFIIFTCPKIV